MKEFFIKFLIVVVASYIVSCILCFSFISSPNAPEKIERGALWWKTYTPDGERYIAEMETYKKVFFIVSIFVTFCLVFGFYVVLYRLQRQKASLFKQNIGKRALYYLGDYPQKVEGTILKVAPISMMVCMRHARGDTWYKLKDVKRLEILE